MGTSTAPMGSFLEAMMPRPQACLTNYRCNNHAYNAVTLNQILTTEKS